MYLVKYYWTTAVGNSKRMKTCEVWSTLNGTVKNLIWFSLQKLFCIVYYERGVTVRKSHLYSIELKSAIFTLAHDSSGSETSHSNMNCIFAPWLIKKLSMCSSLLKFFSALLIKNYWIKESDDIAFKLQAWKINLLQHVELHFLKSWSGNSVQFAMAFKHWHLWISDSVYYTSCKIVY